MIEEDSSVLSTLHLGVSLELERLEKRIALYQRTKDNRTLYCCVASWYRVQQSLLYLAKRLYPVHDTQARFQYETQKMKRLHIPLPLHAEELKQMKNKYFRW
ncbi:hypothetical protein SAMN06265361_103473 [Laceyella tengchongensis]|uniref:Uncharacterized protein n=1 Tax=Laceyella tengchongensis TaxID=574699 RepID=A0AA45WPB7_9BACL|nr:hypothetical protein [Laceyella tengchongensis]SMP21050.1 hypothetical protein SAMN06265361_103473 [Laceyella tengchongensis]